MRGAGQRVRARTVSGTLPAVVPTGEPDDLRRGPVIAEARFSLELPADLVAPLTVRRRYEAWLGAHGWPDAQRDDLVLAVSEAVSNSVEHGYGVRAGVTGRSGVVEVDAVIVPDQDGHRHVNTTVRDHGTWRPQPRLRSYRRHGIGMMRACVAECVIEGTPDGTTVALRSRPVPA